ncbi:hypothetical protein ES702_04376 [subsurface metagenome]
MSTVIVAAYISGRASAKMIAAGLYDRTSMERSVFICIAVANNENVIVNSH